MKPILQTLYIAGIAISLVACHSEAQKQEAPATNATLFSDSSLHSFQLQPVVMGNESSSLELSGAVGFDENSVVKIFPRSSGQVLAAPVSLGDQVRAGSLLATIRSADVAGSYADLASADADIAVSKRQYDNALALYQNGISSEREMTEAKETYQKSMVAKRKIQSQLQINGGASTSASGVYKLTSPIDGYVVEKKLSSGGFIRSDAGDNVFTIGNLKDVWVWANVFEADIAQIHEGSAAQITTLAYPDKVFNGVVDKVSMVLDPQSKAMRVRVKIDNGDLLLRPEMFARIVVAVAGTEQGLAVPTQSLIADNGNNYVVRYGANRQMSIVPVTVLKAAGDKTYVEGTLAPGDQLVCHNQILLFQQLNNR